jgi:hypothetical protein
MLPARDSGFESRFHDWSTGADLPHPATAPGRANDAMPSHAARHALELGHFGTGHVGQRR